MSTFAACLTPAGTGAIASLAVRGPRAWEVVRELLQPLASGKSPVHLLEPGRFWLGRFGDEAADEVILAVKQTQPVPWLEIHCHGGVEVVRLLLDALAKRGVEVSPWQELERRTTGNPLQAEAAVALSEAVTTRTAAILLDQFHGAFERALQEIVAALDRSDEAKAGVLLDALANAIPLGRHLSVPWRVVVAGPPNVGKSSLVNALAGYQRSVVAPTPGTTRDVVTTLIAVEGWAVELADTAGLRTETEELEGLGINRARAAVAGADLTLWVQDGSALPAMPDLPAGRVGVVINKTDLPAAWDFNQFPGAVAVSALTGAGIAGLCQALAGWLVPRPPPAGAAVPFTAAWCERIDRARQLLAAGQVGGVRPLVLGE